MNNTDSIEYIAEGWHDAHRQGYNGPGWYFWDETWAYCYGPYLTEQGANNDLNEYARQLDGLPATPFASSTRPLWPIFVAFLVAAAAVTVLIAAIGGNG